jgi:hypothetical protein
MYKETRNPFFDIQRETVQTNSGITVPNKQALINAETQNVLGLVSPNYEVVTNREVDNLFQEAINDLSIDNIKDHMDADSKRWKRQIIFNDDRLNFEIVKSDIVGILLEIHNGFTGRTSFGYNLMGYRWVCENGMVMGKKSLFSESYAHYVDSPEALRDSFTLKFEAFQKTADVWSGWSEIEFNREEFARFVESHTKLVNVKATPDQYVTPRVSETIIGSYEPMLNLHKLDENKWGAFNVLTALATHKTQARNGSNLFSNRYNTVNRLAADLYDWEDRKAA